MWPPGRLAGPQTQPDLEVIFTAGSLQPPTHRALQGQSEIWLIKGWPPDQQSVLPGSLSTFLPRSSAAGPNCTLRQRWRKSWWREACNNGTLTTQMLPYTIYPFKGLSIPGISSPLCYLFLFSPYLYFSLPHPSVPIHPTLMKQPSLEK